MTESESGIAGIIAGVLGFVVLLFLILIASGSPLATPFWNDVQTRGTEKSYTYVSTHQDELARLAQQYRKMDADEFKYPDATVQYEAEKRATLDRMRLEAATLTPDQIPAPARALLSL